MDDNFTSAVNNGSASFPTWESVCYGIYLTLVYLVGVPGNIVVVIVYGKTTPKTACDWLILTMGVSDTIVCFITPGVYLRTEFKIEVPWMNLVLCIGEQWLHLTAMIASCIILVIIAMDRYVKICRPTLPSLSPIRARNICILCIVFSGAYCVYPVLVGVDNPMCMINGIRLQGLTLGYIMMLLSFFVLSFIIVTFAYINVCRRISEKVRIKQRLLENNGLAPQEENQHMHNNAAHKPSRNSQSLWRQVLSKWRDRTLKKSDVSPLPTQGDKHESLLLNEKVSIIGEGQQDFHKTDEIGNDSENAENMALLVAQSHGHTFPSSITPDTGNEVNSLGNDGSVMNVLDVGLESKSYGDCANSITQQQLSQDERCPLTSKAVGIESELFSNGYPGHKTHQIFEDSQRISSGETFHNVSPGCNFVNRAQFSRCQAYSDSIEKEIDRPATCAHSGTKQWLNNNHDLCKSGEQLSPILNPVSKETVARIPTQHVQISKCGKRNIPQNDFTTQDESPRQRWSLTLPLPRHECTGNDARSESLLGRGFFSLRHLLLTHSTRLQRHDVQDHTSVKRISSSPEIFGREHGVSIHHTNSLGVKGVWRSCECDKGQNNGRYLCSNRMSMVSENAKKSNISNCKFPFVASISQSSPHIGQTSRDSQQTDTRLRNKDCSGQKVVPSGLRYIANDLRKSDSCLSKSPQVKSKNYLHCRCNRLKETRIFPVKQSKPADPGSSHTKSLSKEKCPSNDTVSFELKNVSDESSTDNDKNDAEIDRLTNVAADHGPPCTTDTPICQAIDELKNDAKDACTLAPPFPHPRSALRSTGSISSRESSKTPTFAEPPHKYPQEADSCLDDDDDEIFTDEPTDVFFAKWRKLRAKTWARNSRNSRNSKSSRGSARSNSSRKRFKRERQMTWMLLSVTAAFLVFWIPPWIVYLIIFFGFSEPPDVTSLQVTTLRFFATTHLMNFVASPIIYYIFNPTYKSKVKGLLAPVSRCCTRSKARWAGK